MTELIDSTAAKIVLAIERGDSINRIASKVGTSYSWTYDWIERLEAADIIDSPLLLWESFNHSARPFLMESGPLKPVGTVGEVLMFVESLIAPILLAPMIFVLSCRAAR